MKKIKLAIASSLFDGHDVSINIFRKLLLQKGCEVIHLGHNRSVKELIKVALEEDIDALLVSSYQGGHIEYFKYLTDELKRIESEYILVFGGGGGVILPAEIEELEKYGVEKIYHAIDGQKIGIDGIANDIVERIRKKSENKTQGKLVEFDKLESKNSKAVAKFITQMETGESTIPETEFNSDAKVIGITGPGGSGKSSLTDELINRFLKVTKQLDIAVVTVDPSKRFTGGALLGDRIRFNYIYNERVFFRSLSTEANSGEVSPILKDTITLLKKCGFDIIIVETSGIGQGDSKIVDYVDHSIYVMTAEFGASTQLDKIDMLEVADQTAINKFEKPGSEDAYREVVLNYVRNKRLHIDHGKNFYEQGLPVFPTSSNQFNNPGVNRLFKDLVNKIELKTDLVDSKMFSMLNTELNFNFGIIANDRVHYLAQISDTVKAYKEFCKKEAELAGKCFSLSKSIELIEDETVKNELKKTFEKCYAQLNENTRKLLTEWEETKKIYSGNTYKYQIQNNEYEINLVSYSLSNTPLKKVVVPKFDNWEDLVLYFYKENLPGKFPYTAGVFPFKRTTETPKRQFAGEGSSDRTNKRFHFLTREEDAKRLSVAFDGITLYGENPASIPDIYGKIGESGVSISTIEEMDKLLDNFDLTDPLTSVSMTINAPAPSILAMFFATAFNRELKKKTENGNTISEAGKENLKLETFRKLRGTVQADMLKEDQAQNTCIFSIDFALKLIGDVQEYFTKNQIKNFYSLSISGYHIAEAGANPVTQTAFTLANGFTYVEYFLKRGMDIDDFAPNLSFFFSNGLDPEYAVIGRVARRIWAVAMRDLYKANPKSQKLKYHIQTSGRSLHAQEITFNDIRTTLQALTAYYDNCNSLHTNSYDEAITTPTEESVRRSMAIQMIINDEMGLAKNENPGQGSYVIEELTDLVEEAILEEFYRISHRGGVTAAMEKQYQRSKIQEESLYYEEKKRSGEMPIIGVNKFTEKSSENPYEKMNITRCDIKEKNEILSSLESFEKRNKQEADIALQKLTEVILQNENVFEELLNTVQVASLGQITEVLYGTGGKYRRGI